MYYCIVLYCTILACKAKRQQLLTIQVSSYCRLALQSSIRVWYASKHETLPRCCFDAGAPSSTSAQHQNNIGSMSSVRWPLSKLLLCSAYFIT